MDYEKKYKEALLKARDARQNTESAVTIGILEEIFPELAESKDERIREAIITLLNTTIKGKKVYSIADTTRSEMVAWLEKQGEPTEINPSEFDLRLNKLLKQFESLPKEELITNLSYYLNIIQNDGTYKIEKQSEKSIDNLSPQEAMDIAVAKCFEQGEQKPADKVEPKFKVGDWITDGQIICKVLGITGKSYELHIYNDDYCHFETDVQSVDEHYHLWTIKDAKNGDVLTSIMLTSISFHSNCTFIFNGLDNWKFDAPNGDRAVATGYCCLTASANKMEFGIQGPDCIEVNTVKPATKEQRDLLFAKMKEAGYEWDSNKKELKLLITNGGDFDEKNCEQKHSIDINKMVDDYANNKEPGNEIFGRPVPCMIRAYRQGLNDAVEKIVLKPFDYENANLQQNDLPRYSIGDVLCDKSCTTLNKKAQPNFEITDIKNGMYICDKGSFPISQQDEYELVAKRIEQKPIWGENEIKIIDNLITYLNGNKGLLEETKSIYTDWLKSLKDFNKRGINYGSN